MDAVGKLYENNQLNSGDEVSEIKIGYHTVVPLTNGVQVFAPTWKLTVNDKRSYFVNAIEGVVISKDDVSFLGEAVKFIKTKLQQVDDDKAAGKEMRKMLTEKEKILNRSDTQ
ncbi:two-component system regulatory protein YycI [Virgibacillus halophilus]|uniref:Two-component system regulatory protein YycI n=2 Tax=Tigheibacillus halophilus TaxID=361280 RepID=A0ABU5C5U8_9BACI|nr:two-component system regulatory protein YycI [Virgibacillus halophilus]